MRLRGRIGGCLRRSTFWTSTAGSGLSPRSLSILVCPGTPWTAGPCGFGPRDMRLVGESRGRESCRRETQDQDMTLKIGEPQVSTVVGSSDASWRCNQSTIMAASALTAWSCCCLVMGTVSGGRSLSLTACRLACAAPPSARPMAQLWSRLATVKAPASSASPGRASQITRRRHGPRTTTAGPGTLRGRQPIAVAASRGRCCWWTVAASGS